MRNWSDVLPPDVAKAQHRWERYVTAARMRRSGLTLKQAGARLGLSAQRTMQLANYGERILRFPTVCKSPVEKYLEQTEEFGSTLGGRLRLPRNSMNHPDWNGVWVSP